MKANELMIGNWVNEPFPMQVVSVFQDEIYCNFEGNEGDVFEFKNEDVKPIPLIPEVLEKCGFVPNAIGQLAIEVLGIDTHLELITIDDGYCYINLNQINEFGNSQNVAIDRIRHLHQLQNLYFALTGEELIYKP